MRTMKIYYKITNSEKVNTFAKMCLMSLVDGFNEFNTIDNDYLYSN